MFFLGVSSSLNCGVTPSTKTTTRVVRQRAWRPLTSRRSATRGRVVAFRASATSAVAKSNDKSAIVVGAGPAGALTAAHLAALGWSVDVYERRCESNKVGQSARTYNVVLNSRGLDALAYGGVKLDDGLVVHLSGSVRHREKTGPVFSSSAFGGSIAVDRGVLAATIVREAKEKYGDSIRFHFNKSLYGVNFNTQTAVFERFEVEDGESLYEEARYDLLVGADGVRSRVRNAIAEESAEFNVTQVVDGMKYKTIMLPKLADSHEWSRAFHTWSRGQCSLLAPPNPDGTHTGVVILPAVGEWNWDDISTPQQVDELFAAKFADAFSGVVPARDSVKLAKQRASPGGTTTTVSSMVYKDSVVLIGDAAHSCWPSLGQGANVALESTHALRVTFEEIKDDLPKALEAFNRLRKPQVDACGRLSMSGFGGVSRRTISGLFFARIVIINLIHKLLPTVSNRPAIFEVSNSLYSYDDVERMMRRENLLVTMVVFGVICAAWYCVMKNFPGVWRAVGSPFK